MADSFGNNCFGDAGAATPLDAAFLRLSTTIREQDRQFAADMVRASAMGIAPRIRARLESTPIYDDLEAERHSA